MKNKLQYYFTKSYTSKHIFIGAFLFLCVNVLINLIYYFLGYPHPYTSFLFLPYDRFGDFFKSIDLFQIVTTWEGPDPLDPRSGLAGRPFVNVYNFTLANLILFTSNKYFILCSFFIVCLGAFVYVAKKAGNSFTVIFFALVSYPIIFVLDRGNFALLVFVLLLIALASDNVLFSTFLIGICTALRLTPIVFTIPILVKEPLTLKRLATVISLSLIWFLVINDLSIWFIRNIIINESYDPVAIMAREMENYNRNYILSYDGLPYSSSFFLPFKWLYLKLCEKIPFLTPGLDYIQPVSSAVAVCSIIAFLLLLKGDLKKTFLMITDARKVLFLVSLSFILFMPITGDYYLLVLFIPLLLYPKNSYSFLYVLTCALLLAPKNFHYVGSIYISHHISLQVFLNPGLALILLFSEFDLLQNVKRYSADRSPKPIITFTENRENSLADLQRPASNA